MRICSSRDKDKYIFLPSTSSVSLVSFPMLVGMVFFNRLLSCLEKYGIGWHIVLDDQYFCYLQLSRATNTYIGSAPSMLAKIQSAMEWILIIGCHLLFIKMIMYHHMKTNQYWAVKARKDKIKITDTSTYGGQE